MMAKSAKPERTSKVSWAAAREQSRVSRATAFRRGPDHAGSLALKSDSGSQLVVFQACLSRRASRHPLHGGSATTRPD